MKKTILTVLTLAVLLLAATGAAAAAGVSVYVDDRQVAFPDQAPFIDENARTLVPIRFIAEQMGAEVGWDGSINLVTIVKGTAEIKLTIGEKRAQVNGAWKTFDTSATLKNGRTMVPLRFISETLGAEVEWDNDSRTVYIWTSDCNVPKEPEITPYTGGVPVNPKEWITADGTAEVMRWDNPIIKYITIDDLPHELDTLSIMDITIDNKFVNVTITNKTGRQSAPNMFLAEGNDITRIRNLDNITPINENTYLQKYAIKATYDTHPDLGNLSTEADITKITHFIFEGRKSGQTRLLAVENPYSGGGNR